MTPGTGAFHEPGHGGGRPRAALAAGDAARVERLGDGRGVGRARPANVFDFGYEPANERHVGPIACPDGFLPPDALYTEFRVSPIVLSFYHESPKSGAARGHGSSGVLDRERGMLLYGMLAIVI